MKFLPRGDKNHRKNVSARSCDKEVNTHLDVVNRIDSNEDSGRKKLVRRMPIRKIETQWSLLNKTTLGRGLSGFINRWRGLIIRSSLIQNR